MHKNYNFLRIKSFSEFVNEDKIDLTGITVPSTKSQKPIEHLSDFLNCYGQTSDGVRLQWILELKKLYIQYKSGEEQKRETRVAILIGLLSLIVAIFGLSSCYSVQTYWKADRYVTEYEFQRDEDECIMGSIHPSNQYGTMRVNEETFKECMRIKGYRLHYVNSP